MYQIVVGHTHSHIAGGQLPPELTQQISQDLRYRPAGFQHTWKYKHKKWDGYNYLFNVHDQRFRTGLAWRVKRRFELEKIDCGIQDARARKPELRHMANLQFPKGIDPYEFQLKAAAATLDSSHCVLASPTGTGKTIMMALIARAHRRRTLIVVNSRVLLDQTWEFFDQVMSEGVGIVGSGDFELGDITIATIQSIGSILGIGKKRQPSSREAEFRDWLSGVDVVIHDEVHEADSNTVNELYAQLEAYNFVGMTATPYEWANMSEKGKNLQMEQHFGRKTYDSRGNVDFIGLGITVPLYIYRTDTPPADDYTWYTGEKVLEEYRDVVDKQVIDNDARTEFLAKQAANMVKDGKSCYIFYNRIAYGETICEATANLSPVMLQGKTSRNRRSEVFEAINNKDQLLVVSDIGSYGLNIPTLDTVVLASPVKDVRQLKGRACRSSPGKTHGMIIDPIDNAPYLLKHSKLRKNQYKADGDVIIG
jgi:superfamily II DNA or RNA helicase